MSHPHSVAYRIFNYAFDVSIRVSAIHTDKALREVNPYQCLGPKGSADAMNDVIRVKIPLAVIIMYKMQYEPIIFHRYSDMLTAYKWIREHLNEWLNVIRYDYIRKLPPIDELFAMEELAMELYPHLVGFYGSEFEETTFVHVPDRIDRLISILGRNLSSEAPVQPVNGNNFVRPYTSIMEKIMELRPNG